MLAMERLDEEQFDVYEPFDWESNPNDSDYRMVTRVKVENGQFGTNVDDPYSHPLIGFVFDFDEDSTIEFDIKSVEQLNFDDDKDDIFVMFSLQSDSSKEVKIEASFCLVLGPEEEYRQRTEDPGAETNPVIPLKQEIWAILRDQPINLGRETSFFMTNILQEFEYGEVPFHVEVVIKCLHDQSLTERTSSLTQDLGKLFIDEKQTDFKIVCEGQTFQCHKAILAARSQVFYSMFQMSESSENKFGVVKIEDINAKTMKSLLLYIYQNDYPGGKPDMNLLYAAEKYNLAELVSLCQESIKKNISDRLSWTSRCQASVLASQKRFKNAKRDTQYEVNAPFHFESNPNDLDYLMVKRVKLRNGQFGFSEGDPKFYSMEGSFQFNTNTMDFQIEPSQQETEKDIFIKFTLFIPNAKEDDKKVKIEASFRLVIHPYEYEGVLFEKQLVARTVTETMMPLKPSEKDIYAILKDQPINLGRKKVSFLTKSRKACEANIRNFDTPQFYVEVVIKFLHEQSFTERKRFSLIQDLARLFDDKKKTDFKIVCDGETFKCHKAILAARSDVFYSMFQRSESRNKSGKVKKFKDIDAKTMKSLLRYIYQNHFPEGGEVDMNLLNGAHKYNLAELVSHCQESIVKNISDETAWDIAVSSRLMAYQDIYEAAKKFINTHPSLKAGNAWQTFKKENSKEDDENN
jgi:hypothetical protein